MDSESKYKKNHNNHLSINTNNLNEYYRNIMRSPQNEYNSTVNISNIFPNKIKKRGYMNKSVTENENIIQENKENIFNKNDFKNVNNKISDENLKFTRLKKGVHYRIKTKTSRNNKNNKIISQNSNEILEDKYNQKSEKKFYEDIFPKETGRKSEILIHSYSVDKLNLNSNLGFKFKSNLENSKIFEKNFLKGFKNQERKNALIKTFERYKKFKSLIHNERNNLDESEEENIEKRLQQINRIKSQNIINFKNLYESINNRKSLIKNENEIKKIDCEQKKSQTKIFTRQFLREEKYTIDDDGKEKILEINQSFFPQIINNIQTDTNIEKTYENKEKLKQNNNDFYIVDKTNINQNIKNNNLILQKKRSCQNFNNSNLNLFINRNKNKIFIKKHPKKIEKNTSCQLNNKENLNENHVNTNENKIKKDSINIISKNNIKNHSYREIKKLSNSQLKNEYGKNYRYNKKLLNTNSYKEKELKETIINNGNNNFLNKHYINKNNYQTYSSKGNLDNNFNKIYFNRSYDSKEYSNNNIIHEIINKGNKNESKQFILFNLNNFNDSDKNKNNSMITIYTSPYYKRNYFN